MSTRTRLEIVVAVLLAAILFLCVMQRERIRSLTSERDRYKNDTETLLVGIERYKTSDSLNAARVQALELTNKEYERFRAEDAERIKELTGKNRDLATINKAQAQTIINLQAIPKDTIIVRDSLRLPAVSVHCGDRWYDFRGLLAETEFSGELINRDSLVMVESVRYKKFLFWKTKRVKDRRLDCLSKNPYTTIMGLEHIYIEK